MVESTSKSSNLARKVNRLVDGLRERFGTPNLSRQKNILDELILTLLSQGTSDHNRDLAFHKLKQTFPDWDAVADAEEREVAVAVRSAGLGNQKAARIHSFLHWLRQKQGELSLEFLHDKNDEDAVSLLTRHNGIGIKTAYVTLMASAGRDLFPVDVHIHRIAKRLGLIGEKTSPEKAHSELAPLVPRGRAFEFHMNLLAFGRTICKARNPLCTECGFKRVCLYYKALRNEQPMTTSPKTASASRKRSGKKKR